MSDIRIRKRTATAGKIEARRYLHRAYGPTPRAGGGEAVSERRHEKRERMRIPDALLLTCYGCDGVRKYGERGSFVLDAERWLCDECTEDNRAMIPRRGPMRRVP